MRQANLSDQKQSNTHISGYLKKWKNKFNNFVCIIKELMSSSQKYFFSVSIHTYISRVKSKMQRLSKEAIFQASPVDNEKKTTFITVKVLEEDVKM